MRKERMNRMLTVIAILLIIIGVVLIWFHIPFSPVKTEFSKDIEALKRENRLGQQGCLFKREDFSQLPIVIQRYIDYCGYIGTPQMSYMKMEYRDVDFMQGREGPALKIDYTQYDFVESPCRMALIDSKMFGVPFEGYDYYQNGRGGMKGVIAKGITLFDQTGPEMDKACLVTYLAECMFAPASLLQDYMSFDQISDYEVKATICYEGQTASGIFTFNENYEFVSFTTNDRGVTNPDGTMEYVPWSAVCGEYHTADSGIKYPTKFKAIWNYPEEDFVYFDGVIRVVSYNE